MTERDQSTTRRGAAERRELEAAGWEPRGKGAKTIWRSPIDGHWYADYQAVEMQRKAERGDEEDCLLEEYGFEHTPAEGRREQWSRCEQGSLRLYTRSEAVKRARKEGP